MEERDFVRLSDAYRMCFLCNKANLSDLIAATGLLILLKLDLNRRFFSPCDLEIWWMTPKNNRAPLLCYFKLFASFRSHWWIQTGVTVRKRLIWVNIDAFLSRVTLKFDGWPSKTIGHLFYATSSFVQHFVAIGEFILELESGNAHSGSNSTLFRAVWPWNLTDDLLKQKGTSPKHHQAICIISSSYVNSNWSYGPETVKLGRDLCDLDLWPLTLTFWMDVTFVIGNNSWKFHDDTMMGTWWKRCDGRTDRQTDRRTEPVI